MNRQPNVAIRTLGMLALIALTLTPATANTDADAGRPSGATNAGRSGSAPVGAPIIVAQGRCFNGRCF
jgi:hypothetical protein